jgi:peptidase E
VAFGGIKVSTPADFRPYRDFLVRLTGRDRPRVCVLATATGDHPEMIEWLRSGFEGPGEVSHLALFPLPNVADPEDLLLSQDLVFVGGGSVANMLAVWRVHELDRIMREAWRRGVVLAGGSAGAICWFEGGTTDSFGEELRPFTGGLGFLAGSYCPHYDAEPRRRPLYTSAVASGTLPPGIACCDGVGAHFSGRTLQGLVTGSPGAGGFRVEPDGAGGYREVALETVPLPA